LLAARPATRSTVVSTKLPERAREHSCGEFIFCLSPIDRFLATNNERVTLVATATFRVEVHLFLFQIVSSRLAVREGWPDVIGYSPELQVFIGARDPGERAPRK
jgi:hypothetical protein